MYQNLCHLVQVHAEGGSVSLCFQFSSINTISLKNNTLFLYFSIVLILYRTLSSKKIHCARHQATVYQIISAMK
ncbi:hypothetical protein MITSMUL_04479 [Mitsuokella multacida DSM 20544]|uniref:Uncharacterized protein n=1 Tax=Mitsuokella multacida DSM 20544 TaxID=500635 RepID=C9KMP1_9FIRM|nr:hypothetical protein MITSMUL_04479 [Mitsuokella multacida DSM 20544]